MSEILKAWELAQSQLRNRLGETVFETWILPLKPRFKDGSCVILEAPDKFFKEWVESHYSQSIQEALRSGTYIWCHASVAP